MDEPPRVLSLGAGVNSTAILVLYAAGEIQLDVAIFADTGGEHPETYSYIDRVIIPLCKESNLPFIVVRSKLGSLYDYYFSRQIIPTVYFRQCTSKWKIRPIRKYCKENFGEWINILGIDAGERRRVRSWDGFEFPLVEQGLGRRSCKRIIADHGLVVPRKSGCFYCPFQGRDQWLQLLREHKDLFVLAEKLEKNGRQYPELTLTKKPLEKIRSNFEKQRTLEPWESDQGIGKCMFCEIGGDNSG